MKGDFATKAKRTGFIVSFTILPTITFLVFYVYVNLNSFAMAFQYNAADGTVSWTLDNIKTVFQRLFPPDKEMGEAFLNTFKTFGVNMIMFFVGVFVSYFLYKKIFLYKAFRVIFYLPSIISAVVMCAVYKDLLGSYNFGVTLQKMFGLNYVPDVFSDEKFANTAVLINMVWLTFPGNLIIWGGTFARIPEGVIESARLDGVNWVQEAFRIIIPIVWATFALMFILSIAGIFGASGQVFLLTMGQAGTQTIANWMYMQVYGVSINNSSNAFNYMSALGMFLTVISCAVSLTLRKITGKAFQGVEY